MMKLMNEKWMNYWLMMIENRKGREWYLTVDRNDSIAGVEVTTTAKRLMNEDVALLALCLCVFRGLQQDELMMMNDYVGWWNQLMTNTSCFTATTDCIRWRNASRKTWAQQPPKCKWTEWLTWPCSNRWPSCTMYRNCYQLGGEDALTGGSVV